METETGRSAARTATGRAPTRESVQGWTFSVRRRHVAMAVILLLAVGVRLVYLPYHRGIVDQAGVQQTIAHNILSGHWFAYQQAGSVAEQPLPNVGSGNVMPPAGGAGQSSWKPAVSEVMGPALVLAAVWEVAGSERVIYGEGLQIAIDLGVLLLVYRIVMLLFRRRRAALIAAALYAVCFPIARQASIVDPDIWGVYLTVLIVALYLEALQRQGRHRLRWLLACGVAVGVGAFFRTNVLLLPLAFALASIGWSSVKRPLGAALVVAAVAVLVLVPWTIRNYAAFHRFIPVRGGSGMTLWEGLGETHNNFGAVDNDLTTYLQVHRVHPALEYTSPPYDEYLRARALHVIEQHPLYYAKIVARRVALSTAALYESAWMYHTGESPVLYRARTGRGLFSYILHRPLPLLESMFEPAIFAFAMLALAFTWRRFRRQHLLLIAVVLSALIPYWLLHFEARYALPTLPFYLMWIALGAELLGERVQRRLRPRARLHGAYAGL